MAARAGEEPICHPIVSCVSVLIGFFIHSVKIFSSLRHALTIQIISHLLSALRPPPLAFPLPGCPSRSALPAVVVRGLAAAFWQLLCTYIAIKI